MARRRRDDADIHGLINVCKGPGFTSHDVVAVIRRALGTRRVGGIELRRSAGAILKMLIASSIMWLACIGVQRLPIYPAGHG